MITQMSTLYHPVRILESNYQALLAYQKEQVIPPSMTRLVNHFLWIGLGVVNGGNEKKLPDQEKSRTPRESK